MAVVGNDNIDVGNKTATRKPGQPIVERLARSDGSSGPRIDKPLQTETIGICGAMSLQYGDGGRANNADPWDSLEPLARLVRAVLHNDIRFSIDPIIVCTA